jgi:CRP/FNR family transcriptional regulator, cyclic AMP receptor protein
VVRAGRVKVVLVAEDGREVILGILGVGEHFGELSLIDDQPRSAHVVAMEDSTLLVLRREDFRRRVEQNPAVAWALLLELSRRLRRADEKIGSLVPARRAGPHRPVMLDAAAEGGSEDFIEKPLTHQTIAHVIGASRETVSRAMREFVEAGWITTERATIRITDRTALEKRSQQRLRHVTASPPTVTLALTLRPGFGASCGVPPGPSMSLRSDSGGPAGPSRRPGAQTVRYGGNTPCTELRTDDGWLIILDAGTGIRELGRDLMERSNGGAIRGDIFLTHAHWDHIQGIPFFAPIFGRGNHFTIWGSESLERSVDKVLRDQMSPVVFPVTFEELDATIDFRDLPEGTPVRGRGMK